MGEAFKTFLLIGMVCLATYLAVTQCSSRQAEHDTAVRLRADSTVIANRERDAQLRLSENQAREDRANAKALQDEQDRAQRDNQTALMIAAMNRPQQESKALEYLITGGFLNTDRLNDPPVMSPDSSFNAAVATQGKVLIDTRQQLTETNQALRQSNEEVSDLEKQLLYDDHAITDTRMMVQGFVAERGIARGHSRQQFRQVDTHLSEIQKRRQKLRPINP